MRGDRGDDEYINYGFVLNEIGVIHLAWALYGQEPDPDQTSIDPVAVDHGATRLVLCDTVGYASPDGVKALILFTRELVDKMGASERIGDPDRDDTDKGVLYASGLIAGEGVMGIGIAVAALSMGTRPPGIGFSLEGVTGEVVSLLALGAVALILYRTARRRAS